MASVEGNVQSYEWVEVWTKSSFTSLKLCQSFLNDDMAARKRQMPIKYLPSRELDRDNLKLCGLQLINHLMKEFNEDQSGLRTIINEILHSIFFLGFVHQKPLFPEDFVSANIVETVKEVFPEPFRKFKSHLPKRTPFSGLLHIMELKYDSKEKVIKGLCSLMKELEFPEPLKKPGNTNQNYYTLESTVICVCCKGSPSSKTYFGASVGCKNARYIMIYSSCVNNVWHDYVSHAVMSFNVHRTEGDSLTFPESVRCQAFYRDWKTNTYEEKPPCWKCQRIFNLPGPSVIEQERYPYGNCAETECLSKLLFNDQSVREGTVINNHNRNSRSNCRHLEESTRKQLREELIPAFKDAMMNNEDLPLFNP